MGIGNEKDSLPIPLKYHETIEYTFKYNADGTGSDSFIDKEGHFYKTVKIGNQTWMAENLSTKTTNSWCYGNKKTNCLKYGRLYSRKAAMTACPSGWRLPSKSDFEKLFSAVGGESNAGKSLKSKASWKKNGNGTDAYGFAALPAGFRNIEGKYNNEGFGAHFWTSSETADANDMFISVNILYYLNLVDVSDSDDPLGFSVRCIKE